MKKKIIIKVLISISLFSFLPIKIPAQTIALWLFDEQIGIYPSCVLNDADPNDYSMVIGPGGQIVEGRFDNALEPIEQLPLVYPEGEARFALKKMSILKGRTVEPMTWINANFHALMTSGKKHLCKEIGFILPTKTKLNLWDFDWTIEFLFMPIRDTLQEGVVFEIGQGSHGKNEKVTRMVLNADQKNFTLFNQPSNTKLIIPSKPKALIPKPKNWHHLAFIYSSKENRCDIMCMENYSHFHKNAS